MAICSHDYACDGVGATASIGDNMLLVIKDLHCYFLCFCVVPVIWLEQRLPKSPVYVNVS